MTTIESRSPRPIPPKRSFADFDEPHPSSPQPSATKQLRIETVEAEKAAKTVQQPKPLPLKRPHASFLEDSIDQLPWSPALKRYCPSVTQWLESISGSESYRERHCRSDTLLGHSDSKLIPRRLTKSVPNIGYTRDTDGFAVPPTPASTRSRSYRADAEDDSQVSGYTPSVALSNISGASTGSSRKKSLVEDPFYRQMNLAENNIYIRHPCDPVPEHISSLVDHVGRDRDSPGPSPEQVGQDIELYDLWMGTGEPAVEDYFKANIFPNPKSSDSLYRINRNPMAKHAVPDVGSKLKVSTLVPDMLYGYNSIGAFPQQQAQLRSMGTEMVANSQGLIYPFFVIEFKADGPGGSGSLWVATNQCLGGSASCVNIAERLNQQLRHCKSDKVRPIDSAAFSIAMNGTEARLYVSWKHDELKYYMAKVDSFLLQKPKDYTEFCKNVLNIIDWGKDKRLKEIRKSLDSLLEENRKIASQLAKSRPPPSDDSASSSSHKRKGREYRDQFTPAANERARSMNAEPSPLDSSNYSRVSDTDAYPAEESQTSVDEPDASFSYPVEEPEAPDDELAISFSHPAAASFSFSYRESDYNDIENITEESEASADEIPKYTRSTRSNKSLSKESEKAAPKAPRHSDSKPRRKHRSKK